METETQEQAGTRLGPETTLDYLKAMVEQAKQDEWDARARRRALEVALGAVQITCSMAERWAAFEHESGDRLSSPDASRVKWIAEAMADTPVGRFAYFENWSRQG